MSEHWRHLVEHMPLVTMATAGARTYDFKDLVGVVMASALAAIFGSVLTVQKIEARQEMLEKTILSLQKDIKDDQDLRRREREELLTKVTRIEAERATQQRLGGR